MKKVVKTHTRNQKRMYRIHKLEERVQSQDLLIGSLQQENKQLKEMHETQTKYALENEVKVDKYKEVIEEVRGRSKFERKTALSLNQHYAVSIIDSVLQILDKVKEVK